MSGLDEYEALRHRTSGEMTSIGRGKHAHDRQAFPDGLAGGYGFGNPCSKWAAVREKVV